MRKHVADGTLRALMDNALSTEERDRVERHLSSCQSCVERASVMRQRSARVSALLSELRTDPAHGTSASQLARGRVQAYVRERKERRMARNPFSKRYRPAWALAAVVLLAVITLTVPPVRTLAADLLAVFRVERIAFAPVDVESLPDEEQLEDLAPEIERMFGDTLAVVQESKPVEVSEAEARERAPFTVRLPETEEPVLHEWTPPMHVAVEIDVPLLQGLFDELGYDDVVLPQELDGKTLEADFAGTLTSHIGACDSEQVGQDCVTFVQMASPAASVPDGLDVEQLGRIYLELLGTPADEAAQLSQEIDWTTTLVLPFPHHVNLTHETLKVDGVEGTLIRSESAYRPAPEYLITWITDGVMYALVGKGDYAEALELIDSLR